MSLRPGIEKQEKQKESFPRKMAEHQKMFARGSIR